MQESPIRLHITLTTKPQETLTSRSKLFLQVKHRVTPLLGCHPLAHTCTHLHLTYPLNPIACPPTLVNHNQSRPGRSLLLVAALHMERLESVCLAFFVNKQKHLFAHLYFFLFFLLYAFSRL